MAAGDLITAVTSTFGAQYEWAGVLFGTGTSRIVEAIEGLDSEPELSTDDTDRNDDHGGIVGRDLLKSREVTMSLAVDGLGHADVMATYRTLARVMRPISTLAPFVFQRPGEVKKQVFVRPRKRALPSNTEVAAGLSRGSLNWLAPDPRIFSLVEHSAQIILPAGTAVGSVVINNAGDFHGFARFTLSGAGSNPRITVSAQTVDPLDGTNWNGRTIAADLVMAAGDTLAIDAKTKNITLNGANAYQYRRTDNQWWELMPGNNTITFNRTATTGQQILTVYWFDVWL